jgi:hypothetical protein
MSKPTTTMPAKPSHIPAAKSGGSDIDFDLLLQEYYTKTKIKTCSINKMAAK